MEDRADYATRFKPEGDIALSRRVTGVKLPLDIEAAVLALPVAIRGKWLRRVITEAVEKELINKDIDIPG